MRARKWEIKTNSKVTFKEYRYRATAGFPNSVAFYKISVLNYTIEEKPAEVGLFSLMNR